MSINLVLGADAGCSGVKIVGGKGEVYFRSITMMAPPKLRNFGEGLGVKTEDEFVLEYNNEKYLLGNHAEMVQKFTRLNIEDVDSGSKNNESALIRALAGVARYVDKFEGLEDTEINLYLGYGAPIDQQSDELEKQGIRERFLNGGKPFQITYNGVDLSITVKDILVLPEGISSFFSSEFKEDTVYIADAGSETINLTAIVEDIPSPSASRTLTDGIEAYKELYDTEEDIAKVVAMKIKSAAGKLRWAKGSTIYIGGGFSKKIANAFNLLKDNSYSMEVICPEVSAARKVRKLDSIYANAAGMYFIIKEKTAAVTRG